MADSPPVTRKRGRHNDGDRAVTRDRRHGGSDWKESRHTRHEEQEKAADKRKKLLRAIPTTISGVSALMRGAARSDIREIELYNDMQVIEPEDIAPGAVQATPRPPMPKANQLQAKRERLARWEKDPSLMEKDMDEQRKAVARAQQEDAQLEAVREAWERWYFVLRAHLTAGRRPTAIWSPAAAAAAAAAAASAAAAAAATATEATATASAEAGIAAAAGVAAAAAAADTDADGDGDSDSGSSGEESVRTGKAGKGKGRGSAASSNSGNASGLPRVESTGDLKGKTHTVGGAATAAVTGVAEPESAWLGGGEEEDMEERVRRLEAMVMRRAGLGGEFDMATILKVLARYSREAMAARREHSCLCPRRKDGPQESKSGPPIAAAKDVAHPEDEGSLSRWEELLRTTDGSGGRWQSGLVTGGGLDVPWVSADPDDTDVPGGSSSGLAHRGGQKLLIPKGLDLLPSMRAPYRTRAPSLERQHQGESHVGSCYGVVDDSSGNVTGAPAAEAADAARETDKVVEYVPWIGGIASIEREKLAPPGGAEEAGVAEGSRGIAEWVQWFPRGLPVEVAPPGGGQDAYESAMYNTRAELAIDRLKGQTDETARRQGEVEVKRREKVDEVVRLVRAAAEHEKRRKEHSRRVEALKAQLEILERNNAPASPTGGESAVEDSMDVEEATDAEAAPNSETGISTRAVSPTPAADTSASAAASGTASPRDRSPSPNSPSPVANGQGDTGDVDVALLPAAVGGKRRGENGSAAASSPSRAPSSVSSASSPSSFPPPTPADGVVEKSATPESGDDDSAGGGKGVSDDDAGGVLGTKRRGSGGDAGGRAAPKRKKSAEADAVESTAEDLGKAVSGLTSNGDSIGIAAAPQAEEGYAVSLTSKSLSGDTTVSGSKARSRAAVGKRSNSGRFTSRGKTGGRR